MDNTALVIVNSSAGYKDFSLIRETSRRRGYRLAETEYPGHGREIACRAASAGTPLLIACGGDGTIHEVASGILEAEAQPPLGIIPAGTGNDLCRSLDIAEQTDEAFRIIEENRQMEMDVAKLITENEEILFLNVSSCGFAGEVGKHLEETDRTSWRTLSYIKSGISALGDLESFHVEVHSEGETIRVEALNVVAGNGRYAACGIPVAADASLTDGKLDLVLYMGQGIADQIFNSRLILGGRQDLSDTIVSLRSRKFAMKFSRPLSVNYDGELYGRKIQEVEYVMHNQRLKVIAGRNHV